MSNPPISPASSGHHGGRRPFPPWRLANGVINASDDELRSSAESCEHAADIGAAVVIGAVVLEVALAIWHPPYDSCLNIWGATLADCAIAAGIGAEVLFSRIAKRREAELSRRANLAIAAANERAAIADQKAAEAVRETEKVRRQTAPRALTEEQYKALQTLKGQIATVDIASAKAFEAIQFARQIAHALTSVGIAVNPVGTIELIYPGIFIILPTSLIKAGLTQEPLGKAFQLAGIAVVGCGDSLESPNGPIWVQTTTIFVGEKSNSYPPTYTASQTLTEK